jgi:hypothetical protein
MDHARALAAARYELARAKTAAAILQMPTVPALQVEPAWSDFLVATNRIYAKLQGGANGKRGREWVRSVKEFRQADELLLYLLMARNAEEHGLETSILIGPPRNVAAKPMEVQGKLGIAVSWEPPKHMFLQPLKDSRSGKITALPTTHLGKPLQPMTVGKLAALALLYFEGLIEEAAAA